MMIHQAFVINALSDNDNRLPQEICSQFIYSCVCHGAMLLPYYPLLYLYLYEEDRRIRVDAVTAARTQIDGSPTDSPTT